MKINFILFFGTVLYALLTSCDILPPDDENIPSFNQVIIENQFLFNENWVARGISIDTRVDAEGNEVRARNLREDLPSCELDNFMVFNNNENDNLEVNFGLEICDNDTDNVFDYQIDNSSETLTVGYLIGGFRNVTLRELKFYQSIENKKDKRINANFKTLINGEEVTISYNLINNILLEE